MSAASSVERSNDQIRGKVRTRSEHRRNKNTNTHEVTLPTLCPKSSLSTDCQPTSVVRQSKVIHDVASERTSVLQLPPLSSQVGSRTVITNTTWSQEPGSKVSALGTDSLVTSAAEVTARSLMKNHALRGDSTGQDKLSSLKGEKVTNRTKMLLTGTDVLQMFAQKRQQADFQHYFLKVVHDNIYRPYDLQVVDSSKAGSEHYIFSRYSVLYVTEKGCGGFVSLAEWHKESMLWTALQEITFFRNFRLRKSFTWWQRCVQKIRFHRRCEALRDQLLISVPRFRDALYLFSSFIEDVKETHLLPLGEFQSYTLPDFRAALNVKSKECLQILKKFSEYRTAILIEVREDVFKEHQELQVHVQYAKIPTKCYKPIHLQLAHQQQLKRQFVHSKSTLQKLGNFGSLINHMTMQSLATIISQDVVSFLSVLEREKPQQCSFFQTELCFSAENLLTVEPPVHLFREAVSEVLLTAADYIVETCERCGLFLEMSSSDSSLDFSEDPSGVEPLPMKEVLTNSDGSSGCRNLCSWQMLRDVSAHLLLLPKQNQLMMQGNMVQSCYYPLSKKQLEWQIRNSDPSKHAETELVKIMKAAEADTQRMFEDYKWLVHINAFINQWSSSASVESMTRQPASQYEEDILKICEWIERINTIPSTVSTSTQMFIIHCTNTKETLEHQLKVIEKALLEQLVMQIKLHSKSFISDLEMMKDELVTDPQDSHDLSTYAQKLSQSLEMVPDMQTRLEYIHSLQDVVCRYYREMTEQEQIVEDKMLRLWESFRLLLNEAESVISHRRPSAVNAVDTMVSLMGRDLEKVLSEASSGPFLDPAQNAEEMVSKLNEMCSHGNKLYAKLKRLNTEKQNLQGCAVDLNIFTANIEKVTACNDLWKLRAAFTTWSEEWKLLLFSKVQVSEAQQKIVTWKEQARSITGITPTHDAVLQGTFEDLESFSNQLAVMAKLQSPTLRLKHWRAIFKGLNLPEIPEKEVTVNELMSKQLEVHQKLITQICSDAEAEFIMEQTFLKLQKGWKTRLLELDDFTQLVWQQPELTELQKSMEGIELQTSSQHSCNESRFIITGFETCFAEIENDLMSLSVMLKSPYSLDIREQMEDWVQSLQYLEKLLDLFESYQQMWTSLTTTFNGTIFASQHGNLLEEFKPVDMEFKEIMQTLSADPHVLNLIDFSRASERFSGNDLYTVLINGLSIMEMISSQMTDALDSPREQFPRLWFLSDKEVFQLRVGHPAPSIFQFFVQKCFKGVHSLDFKDEIKRNAQKIDGDEFGRGQIQVWGFSSLLEEHIHFISPIKQNLHVPVWLNEFEKTLSLTVRRLLKQCYSAMNKFQASRNNRPVVGEKPDGDRKDTQHVLDVLAEYPLQCVLLAEEAKWCSDVLQAFRETSDVKLSTLKKNNAEKLKNICLSIRNKSAKSHPSISKYTMVCLGALVQLTMNHARQLSQLMEVQCQPESSFEWLSLLKYHIGPESPIVKGSDDPPCQVNVFGYNFQYGCEYFGPEDCVMVHTPSTDRAVLGILLALTSYRCGYVTGPCMSGKTKTVLQLGTALGRQVVLVQCSPPMRLLRLQQMLSGALQTGAWLLLDSVDLLTSEVLSSVGQHLLDIHQSFCGLSQRATDEQKETTAAGNVGCLSIDLAGKKIPANPNYGCALITSKGCTSNFSESLCFVIRPVVLIRPDYRIIAEVTLTSFGFSDAVALSHRLVTLISLLKDSFCLPGFISQHQSSHLITLQKIISVSGKYFKESLREQDILNEAAEKNNLMYFQNVSCKEPEKAYNKSDYAPRSSSSCFIKQSLMEEMAVVKAILSVLIPAMYDQKKASQFYVILKDSFPLVSQFPLSQHQDNQLRDAVTRELQLRGFYPDPQIICSTLTLHQTIQFSQTVLLIGPSGSGKTTSYSSLAGALSSLAATKSEHVMDSQTLVNTVVLFPNAMSRDDLFGFFCAKRGWQDGAVTKLLRKSDVCTVSRGWNMQKKSDHKPVAKWLVMDGDPVGQPSWLDYLTTLCDAKDPCFSLPSGEKLVPSKLNLKVLFEMTDLSDVSPSTLSRCSLVNFVGADVWKSVWKKEVTALSRIFKLDQDTLKVWNRLAEDLFSQTLSLLRQKALISAVSGEGKYSNSPTRGLQEILSFVRLLSALLQYFQKELENTEARQDTRGDVSLHDGKLLARNIFLLAYIWGFGGHLHPSHWPQFDLLVRQVLLCCRYKIVIPEEESVFEHFFGINVKMFPKNTPSSEYRKYSYLLNIMLEANQPVLLAGECASGKTNLCQSLLRFDRPHIGLTASPLLSYREFLVILKNIGSQRLCKDDAGSVADKSRLLLFVDDLQEAPCDSFGKKSTALESLRQSMSTGGILTFINNHFELLNSAQISYLATYCVSGCGRNVLSPRLSQLFSVFVLPSRSTETIFSLHSQRFHSWLEGSELQQSTEDMTRCIITATKTLCHAVSEQFQPTAARPHLMFSQHDIQKVFEGMYLWQPTNRATWTRQRESALSGRPQGLTETSASVAYLWMHECMRTFADRLWSEKERTRLVSLVAKVATEHFGIGLDKLHNENVPVDVPPAVTKSHPPTDTKDTCEQTHEDTESTDPMKKDASVEASPVAKNNTSDDKNLNTGPVQPQTLQHIETIMLTLVYGPELLEPDGFLEQQHKFKLDSCYVEQDPNVLLQKLSVLLDRNQGSDVVNDCDVISRYVLHTDRVKQLLHIQRALLVPGGHGVLTSSEVGTGRKTTVRLAALITGHQLIEVHPGNENELHEILKEAGNRTRVDGVKVIILAHEEISECVREELLVTMARRTYPAVYTEEELNNLVSRVTAVEMSTRYRMDSWMLDKFLNQVHKNVHVFLLMSNQSNNENDNNRQLLKALRLGCCIELYRPWSSRSLMEVAAQRLKNRVNDLERESLVECLSVTTAGIHQSACRYASVLLQAQPFSPQTYVEFLAHFDFVFNHLKTQYQERADRVASLVSVLDSLNNGALQNKQHIERLKMKVAKTQQCEEGLLRAADNQRRKLDETQKQCTMVINRIKELEMQKEQLEGEVRSVFLSAVEILKCLNPSDLEEVRHYRDPPDRVVTVMDSVCLLFDRPLGWESAKQLLGQSNFFQELEFFDRFSLTDEQLQQLSLLVKSPLFVPESVREVSKACESLCRWVQAVYECCSVQQQLLIKQQLEQQVKEARGRLCLAKQHRADAHRRLRDLKLQLRFVQKDLKQYLMELHKAEDVDREATLTAEQLEIQETEWRAAVQEVKLHHQNLPGDAVILAAIIAYLGPFASGVRTELITKWRELCRTGNIDINPQDPRSSLLTQHDSPPPLLRLGFPISVSEELQEPVGRALVQKDWHLQNTARLVVQLLLWGYRNVPAQCCPLLADTQQYRDIQSQSWCITGEKDKYYTEYDLVICADDSQLLDKLDGAAQCGLKVLVTHVERAIPSSQFLHRLSPPARCCLPGSQKHSPPAHPKFCLFLSTNLSVRILNKALHPSVLAHVRVVDLSLSSDEIQELMLTQLLQSECKELLIHHKRLQNDKRELQERLATEEDALIGFILQSKHSELELCEFRSTVSVFQEAMKRLQDEAEKVNEELKYHKDLVAGLQQLVSLAAALYQTLQDVSRLSPVYCFPLRGFIKFIQNTVTVKGRPLVSFITGKVPVGIVSQVTNKMVPQLLRHYRPLLFKSHFAVLKLLVSVAVLRHDRLCSEGEAAAFIRGLQDIEAPAKHDAQSCASVPSWIPTHIHSELLCLENIPSFRGLVASLSSSSVQWQEYMHSPSSALVGAVPCRSHSHLSLLQRALLWRIMNPSCLGELADVIAGCHLCLPVEAKRSEAPHTGNPHSLLGYMAKHEGPIILTLPSSGGDKLTSTQPLQLITKLADSVPAATGGKQKVRFISFGVLFDGETCVSALKKAASEGHWLVFNDCHLLNQWDDEVVTLFNRLFSSVKEQQCGSDSCFRVWFITHEDTVHHIPATVRLCSLTLVCDSPWDLKEELSLSLQEVSFPNRDRDTEFLLRSATFHSVLLQRQSCKLLGQGRIYNWNQVDLVALVEAHHSIVRLCHNRTKALHYVAVSLVHGGHVSDPADLEVVGNIAERCLSRESPLWSRDEPHSPAQFDLSRLLNIMEQSLKDSANTDDPLLLGFGVDVAAEIIKINSHNLNILLQASQTPPRSIRTLPQQPFVMPGYSQAADRLQALKTYLTDKKSRITNAGAAPQSPLCDFLQAQRDELLDTVATLLSRLRQPVQYGTETVSSLLCLEDLSHLQRRAELLSSYVTHNYTSDPPGAYRLSAFSNAKGFLVAMMREASRVNRKYVSDIILTFQVLNQSTCPALSPPVDAVYLCGLELRGASWNNQCGVLEDTVSSQPCTLPPVCIKAEVRSKINVRDDFCSGKSSYLMDKNNVQISGASPSTASELPVYHCPLYLDGKQGTGESGLADANIITLVPLRTRLNPVSCNLKRVRLVSVL